MLPSKDIDNLDVRGGFTGGRKCGRERCAQSGGGRPSRASARARCPRNDRLIPSFATPSGSGSSRATEGARGPLAAEPGGSRPRWLENRRSASGRARPRTRPTKRRSLAVGALASLACGLTSVVVLSPGVAYASVTVDVPCSGPSGGGPGLIAAVDKANASRGATVDLTSGCTYAITTDGTSTGGSGLPVVTTPVIVNGNGARKRPTSSSRS